MKEPRKVGLALIFLGVVIMLGNTTEALPPEAFFAGLFLYPIGGLLFFKGSRAAINKAEARAARIVAPRLRNKSAEKQAQQQKENIDAHGSVDAQVHSAPAQSRSQAVAPSQDGPAPDLVLYEVDADSGMEGKDDFKVVTDVSFPLEVQEQDSLAEQIMKLHQLRESGIITEEEMTIAKAKLLS
ncbi:MAG: SHOCT domain-containing protein [Myxococcales bacterium]|nr:SHOCT domain-containing protein [Myxococcales bacterium]MCH7866737.1 SHOCT domain-containing protein [Myxococcales bacterium]